MAIRTILSQPVAERASALLTTTLRDLNGAGLAAAALDSVTLTLYDDDTDTVLNSRSQQSILNTNGGTVNSSGGLTLRLDAADTAIVTAANTEEVHIALIEWQWTVAGVVYQGKAEIAHRVKNLKKVPAA